MKKKKSAYYFITVLLSVVAMVLPTGCTHNNGDIGDWFGTWQLETIEINGTTDQDYHATIFWKFQNCVIEMQKISLDPDDQTRRQVFGTWEESGDDLILNFSYSDDQNPPELGESGRGTYAPFVETRLPYGKPAVLEIMKGSGNRKELRYIAQTGETIIYRLVKR